MANIKSAIKRIETNKTKKLENQSIRSRLSTYVKKYKASIEANDLEGAEKLLSTVFGYLDSAAKKNIIHKNTANSKKSSLSKMLDTAKKAV